MQEPRRSWPEGLSEQEKHHAMAGLLGLVRDCLATVTDPDERVYFGKLLLAMARETLPLDDWPVPEPDGRRRPRLGLGPGAGGAAPDGTAPRSG